MDNVKQTFERMKAKEVFVNEHCMTVMRKNMSDEWVYYALVRKDMSDGNFILWPRFIDVSGDITYISPLSLSSLSSSSLLSLSSLSLSSSASICRSSSLSSSSLSSSSSSSSLLSPSSSSLSLSISLGDALVKIIYGTNGELLHMDADETSVFKLVKEHDGLLRDYALLLKNRGELSWIS